MRDFTVHCFRPGSEGEGLWTLCGQRYQLESLAMWPDRFLLLIDEGLPELCPACVDSEDLELAVLGWVA